MARKTLAQIAISSNEERWVKGWCENILKSNPDVVVVNLTQYADKSEALFKEHIPEDKLVFVKHPWQKSFAEARQHTLDEVGKWEERTGKKIDFCMFIDLDEYITAPSFVQLDAVLNRQAEHAQYMCNIYNTVTSEAMLAVLYYPRLFPWRNAAGERLNPYFEGAVHNQVVYPVKTQQVGVRTNINIKHEGYALDEAAMAVKHKRSEELLQNQIKADDTNYFAHLNYAQLLRAKGDVQGSLKSSLKVLELCQSKIDSDDSRYRDACLMAYEQAGTAYMNLGKAEHVIEMSEAGLKLKADHLDSLFNMGHGYMMKQDMEKSIFWLKRYLFIRSRYDELKDNTNLILNHLNSSFMALYHLGNIYAFQKKNQDAKEHYERALEEAPKYADLFIRYIDLLRRMGLEKDLQHMVNEFMYKHAEKNYQIYEYFGDTELEDANIEGAKFNYYQAANICEGMPEQERIQGKWDSVRAAFGEVSANFFNTAQKHQEMQERIA